MTDSSDAADIEILRCPRCSGGVPLTSGDTARCVFCGTAVPIPPQLRALRDAERVDAATRRDAESYLIHRLAKPPGRLLAFLGSRKLAFASILLCPFYFIGAFAAAIYAMRLAEWTQREVFVELHTQKWLDLLVGIVACAVLSLVVLLGSLGRRRALGRKHLQRSLLARPPERPCGPALCRSCGAPLVVPPGALNARCTYCRTDSLVVGSPGDDRTVSDDELRLRRAIVESEQDERADRGRVFWSIVIRVVLLSLTVPCFLIGPIQEDGDFSGLTPWHYYHDFLRDRSSAFTTAPGEECGADTDPRFALRRGEAIHASRSAGDHTRIEVTVWARVPGSVFPWLGEQQPESLTKTTWDPGASFDYVAPHTGWFILCIDAATRTRIAVTVPPR